VPKWRGLGTVAYNSDSITASLTARAVSSGVYDNSFVVCTSNCPTSTINNQTINRNHIDGAVYFDLALAYRFQAKGTDAELYLNVRNVLNSDPVIVAPLFTATWFNPLTAPDLYDYLGAVIRAGIRFEI
jgi:iron complex outermembrane recepter protein